MKNYILLIITACIFCSVAQAQLNLDPDPTKWSDADLAKYNSERDLKFAQLDYDPYKWSPDDRAVYDSVQNVDIALNFYGRIPAVPEIGEDFADADLSDPDGNTKRIADYLGNKYLLLQFWHRCYAVRMALPELKEIAETYSDKLTIINIGRYADAEWKEAMAEYDMAGVHLNDPEYKAIQEEFVATRHIPLNLRNPKSFSGLNAAYCVTGTPTFVMISPEGKIVYTVMGYGEGLLNKIISENIE